MAISTCYPQIVKIIVEKESETSAAPQHLSIALAIEVNV
jgi:hypothetical protein